MADIEKTEKNDISVIQNEIRVLEKKIKSLNNEANTIDYILQGIEKHKTELESKIYTYRSNLNLSSEPEDNSEKLREEINEMAINYNKSDDLYQSLSSKLSRIKDRIAIKNQELSNKKAELRGYM